MLLEQVQKSRQQLKQTITQTKQAVDVLLEKIGMFCQELYNQLADNLRFVLDYVSPAVQDADEAEVQWIARGVGSVLHCFGNDDPVDAYCQMSPEERLAALQNIADTNAKLMGIEVCEFLLSERLPAAVPGFYNHKTRCITIKAMLVYAQPITRETAKQAIMTVIHETFHAYQYTAMYQPHQFGIPEEIAAYWRQNARNYCTFEQNPSYYHLQPLESYAGYVVEGVMSWLNDPEMMVRDSQNIYSEEGV